MGREAIADALPQEQLIDAVEIVAETRLYFKIAAYFFIFADRCVQIDGRPPLKGVVCITIASGS